VEKSEGFLRGIFSNPDIFAPSNSNMDLLAAAEKAKMS
jgi:hypothetical protein